MPGTVKSELLPDADRLHKCDGQEKVCEIQHLPLDKSHFITVYKAMNEVGKYRKISKAIKYDIFSKLEENMPLPSVRMLSQVYSVNPATIVKALHILKYQGIIYNKRTNGYYVCPNILEMREIFVKEIVSDFLQNMVAIGYSPSSILEMLREVGDNMGK